jgi:hypothetical protein
MTGALFPLCGIPLAVRNRFVITDIIIIVKCTAAKTSHSLRVLLAQARLLYSTAHCPRPSRSARPSDRNPPITLPFGPLRTSNRIWRTPCLTCINRDAMTTV